MPDRADTYGRGRLIWLEESAGVCKARLTVSLPRSGDGGRHRKTYTLVGTKRQIEKERLRILTEASSGNVKVRERETLGEFLQSWLNTVVALPGMSPRTRVCYQQYIEYYIRPRLGQVRLSELAPSDIQSFYATLLREGRRRTTVNSSPGLSATTVANIHRVLHTALAYAVKTDKLNKNPADVVTVPKRSRTKQRILSSEQVALILQETENPRLRLLVLLGICCGVRRGEALGLRWCDVDLGRELLTVRQTLVDTGVELVMKEPKTEESVRVIKMPTVLTKALRTHRTVQNEQKQLLPTYEDHDLVLCWEDGRPIHPHRLYRPLKNLLRRLGLDERTRIHDLRHSHATHLLEANVHPKVVAERLGHRDIETTLNIYSHALPHMQDTAAQATDDAVRNALNSAVSGPVPPEDGTKMAQNRGPGD